MKSSKFSLSELEEMKSRIYRVEPHRKRKDETVEVLASSVCTAGD